MDTDQLLIAADVAPTPRTRSRGHDGREPDASLAALRALPWGTVFAGIAPASVHEHTASFACSDDPPPLLEALGTLLHILAKHG